METTKPLADATGPSAAIILKLSSEVRLRKFTERVLDSRQQELDVLEEGKKALAKQVASLKKQLAETKAQLSDADDQLRAKGKQLQAARDQVFRLQLQRKDLTESEAAEAYQNLYGSVQHWVEHRVKGLLDDIGSSRVRDRPSSPQSARFVCLMREAAKRCVDVGQSDEYHIVAVIMQYLWLVLFSKSFYCPLDGTDSDDTVSWIDDMATAMARQPRDLVRCREWRSETLSTLTKQGPFKARRLKYLNLVAEDLSSLLTVVVPHATADDLAISVRRAIVEPAADLAHRLHLATNFYTLRWPARSPWMRLEVFSCVNVSSGGTLVGLKESGADAVPFRKVSYLFDVAPGLFIERVDGDKKGNLKALRRPTVLVHASDDDVAQKATIIRWLWEHSSTASMPSSHGGRDSTAALQRSPVQPQQNLREHS